MSVNWGSDKQKDSGTTFPGSSLPRHLSVQPQGSLSSQGSGMDRTTSSLLVRTASKLPVASSNKQADAYISELLSYSLDRLRKEPELLRAEKEQIERNIQTTAVSQYGAFIDTAKCLQTIDSELHSVCDYMDKLLQGTPELAASCDAFSGSSAELMEQYAQNKQLANSQSVLLELLEVPQLMDTCVRNGIFDEALDLQAFVTRLGLLHSDVPVVKLLLQQVGEVGNTMLQQLLGRLKTNVQLPECLRIMGYLRRVAAFSEADLRLQFLKCRDEWISQLISDLDDSDSYEYVKHLTDVHRLHLFDAVMQYRAIFFDTPQSSGQEMSGASGQHIRETSILHSWVQHRVCLYLEALRKHLPNIREGGNLASVVEHCMYCGSSLSRVGLDFQGLLQPLLEDCILHLFMAHLSAAVDAFNSRLESHKWVAMHTPLVGKQKVQKEKGQYGQPDDSADLAALSSTQTQADAAPDGDLTPPPTIMEHLPLAVFTNAVLGVLNELRHCAILSLCKPMSGFLQEALEQVASSIVHYRHTHTLQGSELQLFELAVRVLLDVMLPYFISCFSRIFGATTPKMDLLQTTAMLRELLQTL